MCVGGVESEGRTLTKSLCRARSLPIVLSQSHPLSRCQSCSASVSFSLGVCVSVCLCRSLPLLTSLSRTIFLCVSDYTHTPHPHKQTYSTQRRATGRYTPVIRIPEPRLQPPRHALDARLPNTPCGWVLREALEAIGEEGVDHWIALQRRHAVPCRHATPRQGSVLLLLRLLRRRVLLLLRR